MPVIRSAVKSAAEHPVKVPENTEKRYRFFMIACLAKADGAVYNEKNWMI